MNLEELKDLLELILERDITEFELEEKGIRLKIKKGSSARVAEPAGAQNPVPFPVATAKTGKSPQSPDSPPDSGVTLVRSPMVGTFYRAPEPNAPPFVKEGDRVELGQVLCIIEAMKLMNEIESEEVGEIVRVFAENGQPVQYGDELFAVRVSA